MLSLLCPTVPHVIDPIPEVARRCGEKGLLGRQIEILESDGAYRKEESDFEFRS